MAEVEDKKVMGWLWLPVGADSTHPADVPKDETTAAKRWNDNIRGPRLARITQVSVLVEKKAPKPNHVYVMVKDNLREVPKHMVLHEREGFLIIQELIKRQGDNAYLHADWVDAELKAALEKHSQGKVLASAQYVSKILIKKAVTGVRYFDENGREAAYRRDIREKEDENIPEGEEKDGFFCIQELADYMPPWEAFCHAKCGFYQDFYKVRWAHPYSEIDYGQVENGCADEAGATWEPDESLPPCLDAFRIKSKKSWFTAQSEREAKAKRVNLQQAQPIESKRLRPAPVAVKKEEEVKEEKIDLAQLRRDGSEPLDQDLVRPLLGHDLVPESSDKFPSIRKGWPRKKEDYPPGFSVAAPPGYCWDGCDCMDDQRGQREWEVTKSWIAKSRAVAAQAAIDNFSRETQFVRARGAVSKTYYFETAQTSTNDTPAQRAAADLALLIQGVLRELCVVIPFMTLISTSDPLYLPSRAILTLGNGDYVPLSIHATLDSGAALPSWLKLDASTGLLSMTPDHRMESDLLLQIQFKFFEGTIKTFTSRITLGDAPPSSRIVAPVLARFRDLNACKIENSVRALLDEQLMHVTGCPLGRLIQILSRCQGILRAASVANLSTGSSRPTARPSPGESRPLAGGHSNGAVRRPLTEVDVATAVPLTPT